MKNVKCQIVFFGTPDFAIPSLKALNKASFCHIKAVITQPDKAVGRHHSRAVPSPIKQASQRLKIAVLEGLDGLKGVARLPARQEADMGVVVAYGEILPQWVLDKFPLGVLNIHPSLLPKYRGSSPIQTAILNQDQETGVSIIKLDAEMDHGPIVAQEVVSLRGRSNGRSNPDNALDVDLPESHIQRDDRIAAVAGTLPRNDNLTAGELYDILFQMGADLLVKILPDYISGKMTLKPQDDSLAIFTKKLSKEDGKIDWSKSPAAIAAHVRAMNPWPGAWTMWKNKRLIVWKMSSDGALQELQLEGKKKMAFTEFCKGHPGFDVPVRGD